MSLRISGISKKYKSGNSQKFQALDRVSLEIAPGRIVALIGQNGAGKTTLMKSILGLVKPDQGGVDMDGISIKQAIGENRVAYMPEVLANMGPMTGREYMEGILTLRGLSVKESGEYLSQLEQIMYVGRNLDIPMMHCSKGNLKKIAFIQAILCRPQLLLLDEPTDGLDPISRRSMLTEIAKRKTGDQYTILSTHLLSDIEMVADEICVLQKGKIIAQRKLKELKQPLEEWYIDLLKEYGEIDEL